MRRSTRVTVAFLSTVLCALAGTACAPSQVGSPKAGQRSQDLESDIEGVQTVDFRKDFAESPQSVNEYWTKDRLGGAKPNDPKPGDKNPGGGGDQSTSVVIEPVGATVGAVPANANGDSDDGARWSMAGLSGRTVGRLYFVQGGQNYVCSGAVVNSKSGMIVATAGHCVYETDEKSKRAFASRFLFIPGDKNNGQSSPYGRWAAESAITTAQFVKSAYSSETKGTYGEGWQYDTAFLRMRKQNGKTIQQAVGGAQGIAFGAKPEGLMVLGYPAGPPFDGRYVRYCSASTARVDPDVYNDYQLPCVMTGGCSGGPWLTRFDPRKGVGYVVSTSSVGNDIRLNGAQMGKAAYEIYQKADQK